MNIREFNRILNSLCTVRTVQKRKFKALDKHKVSQLNTETKNNVIAFLVRKRQPIAIEFLNRETNYRWLAACGYIYRFSNRFGYSFLGTGENMLLW